MQSKIKLKRPYDIVDGVPKVIFIYYPSKGKYCLQWRGNFSLLFHIQIGRVLFYRWEGGVRGVMCKSKNSDTCSFYELLLVEGLYFKT